MNWGSREECHCTSTVWAGINFDLGGIRKKVLDTLSNFALKTRYLIFQHKSLFNLVKDLFKWIEGLERSLVRVKSEGAMNFWPRWYTKKVLDTLSNFALKTRYIVFHHKSLFNLVKDLFKWIEGLGGLGRSVTVQVKSEGEKNLWPRWYTKKVLDTLSNFALKTRYSVSK